MAPMTRSTLLPVAAAAAATVPSVICHVAGLPLAPPVAALVSGSAILGASCLLLWACDAAQADVSQALALAAVALMAVLPEYAVDMYFTWQAGQHPDSDYAHYAVANMTGANRLLIGVAWGAIALLYWIRFRRPVRLGTDRRTELLFLGAATLYAFAIPMKGALAWYDGVVFLGLYVAYIVLAARRPTEECEPVGPAAAIVALPRRRRRTVTTAVFLVAGGVILLNAQLFCEGLIGTGRTLGVSEFALVQWLAPIASEAPEFIVALVFAWRGQASLALASLLSSKLNQWTLLVGMIPGVFAVSVGSLAHPIPMGSLQMSEILLTAAQSVLGVVLLASLRLSLPGSALLFGLFAGQLVLPAVLQRSSASLFGVGPQFIHPLFSLLYVTAAAALFLARPQPVFKLAAGLQRPTGGPDPDACACPPTADRDDPPDEEMLPRCVSCRWRVAAVTQGVPAGAGSSAINRTLAER